MTFANEDWDTQMFYALEKDWENASLKVTLVLALAFSKRWPDPMQLHQELQTFALKLHEKALIETGIYDTSDEAAVH